MAHGSDDGHGAHILRNHDVGGRAFSKSFFDCTLDLSNCIFRCQYDLDAAGRFDN